MRLVMTLLVRDEADVLASHLDYHLAQGVDFVIAMDNGSSDDTEVILKRYESSGVLRLLPSKTGAYSQGPWVTEMARLAATEHGADWVINNDADEFWWPSLGTLSDVLAAVPEEYAQVRVPRNDFHPVRSDQRPAEIFWRRMLVRDACSVSPRGARLVPKVVHRAHPEVTVTYGNHSAEGAEMSLAPPIGTIEILHYPMRTYDQFERKIRNIAEFSRDDPSRPAGALDDQLYLDDLLRAGELASYYDTHTVEGVTPDSHDTLVDTRLRDFLEDGIHRRPDQAAAQAIMREHYIEVEAWTRSRTFPLREQLGTAELALSDLRREHAEITAAYKSTDDALVAERAEHYRTAEDLRLLRQSRAVRVTRQLRRLWPRL